MRRTLLSIYLPCPFCSLVVQKTTEEELIKVMKERRTIFHRNRVKLMRISSNPFLLQVRTQPDKSIVIEGKHEERTSADTGSPTSTTRSSATKRSPGLSSSISGLGSSSSATSADRNNYNAVLQQFSRQFSLPPGCDPLRVVSNLSRDGVLVITAPKKIAAKSLDSRSVPIKH